MVNKTIKIKLNVSNKLLYSVLAIFIIIAIAGITYAYGGGYGDPSIMGHTANEIDGLGDLKDTRMHDTVKGLYVNEDDQLCFQHEVIVSGDCESDINYCTESDILTFFASPKLCEKPTDFLDDMCDSKCTSKVACQGEFYSDCTSGLDAYYFNGSLNDCFGEDLLCNCDVVNRQYVIESPGQGSTTDILNKCMLFINP